MTLGKLPPRFGKLAPRVSSGKVRATARISGRARQAIRKKILARDPLCVLCIALGVTRAATVVDHIQPLWRGGAESDSNRQALCEACHDAKTAKGNRRARLDVPDVTGGVMGQTRGERTPRLPPHAYVKNAAIF